VPPPEDPFDMIPAFDPAHPETAPPPPPGSQALAVAPPSADDLDVPKLRHKLKELAAELLTASPARTKALKLEIQRVRCAAALFNEADTGESDPETYKELSLLTRMLADEDDLTDPTTDEVRHAEAEALLKERGIDPDAARRMARLFESLSAAEDTPDGAEPRRRRSSH
jgi:hypothetical protein